MPIQFQSDFINPQEILYRRIPKIYFTTPPFPSPVAYKPFERDKNGISLTRSLHKSEKEAAQSPADPSRKSYLSTLKAQTLITLGLELEIDQQDISHVLVKNLTYANYKEKTQQEWQVTLANLDSVIDPWGLG